MITSTNYADYVKLLTDILTKGGQVSDGVVITADKEINIKLSLTENGCRIDFLAPEPKVKIHKVITISDTIDYIKILNDGNLLLKTRGWAWEISVELKHA